MNTALADALNRIEKWLQQHRPILANALQPGLSYAQIEEEVASLPFHVPKEVYELYQWHNGTGGAGILNRELTFLPNYSFPTLEETITTCHHYLEVVEQTGLEYMPPPWFPLFWAGAQDLYVITCGQQPSGTALYLFTQDFPSNPRYTSLTVMMQTVAECYEMGAYYLDAEGYLVADSLK